MFLKNRSKKDVLSLLENNTTSENLMYLLYREIQRKVSTQNLVELRIKNAQTSRTCFWGRHISYIFSTYASNLQRRSIITLKFRWKKSEKIHPMEHHWIILQLIPCSSSSLQQLMKEGLHQHWPLWITTIVTFIVNLLIFNKKVYLKTDIDVKYRQVHHLKSVMGYNVCWS